MNPGRPTSLWALERRGVVAAAACALALQLICAPLAAQENQDVDELDESELFELPEDEVEQRSGDDDGERRQRRIDGKPLSQMNREEARASGFVFGAERDESTRTSATFLAATAGVLAHGVGHWYLDERRTAGMLMAAQGVSIGLIGSAFLWEGLSDGSPASRVYAGPAIYAGLGLFGLSYLLDVIGTIHNTDIGVAPNTRRTRGISAGAEYSYFELDGYGTETLQVLTADTRFDLGWGYLGARTDQDVYLDTSIYGATLGARPWRGPGEHTFAFVEADGEFFRYRGSGGFQRLAARGRAGVSLGLGSWISQLRNLAVGMSAGFGRHWYALPVDGGGGFEQALSRSYVPLEMFLHFNLTEGLNARAGWEHGDGEFLQSAPAGLGVASLEFLYRSADRLDLVVRAEAGGGVGVSGGLRVWFWE